MTVRIVLMAYLPEVLPGDESTSGSDSTGLASHVATSHPVPAPHISRRHSRHLVRRVLPQLRLQLLRRPPRRACTSACIEVTQSQSVKWTASTVTVLPCLALHPPVVSKRQTDD